MMNSLFSGDHEFVSRIEMLEGGSRVGLTGFREWRRENDAVAEQVSRVEELTEIDADRVLVIVPTSFTFKLSGLQLEDQRFACVVTVREGKIVRTEVYDSEAEALETIGR